MAAPMPPSETGLTWRSAGPDDAPTLTELYNAWEEHVGRPWRSTRDEIEHHLADPDTDPEHDTLVAFDAAERAVAACWAFPQTSAGPKRRVFLDVVAHPERMGLIDFAIRWTEHRARQILTDTADGRPAVLRAWAEAGDVDGIAAFERHGYSVARYFVDMTRTLEDPLPAAPPPDGVRIVAWKQARSEEVRATHSSAFADHWGSLPPDEAFWRRFYVGHPHFRDDLSLLAVGNGDVVGYSLNHENPSAPEMTGASEAVVETLGVHPGWRRRGIASALLAASLRRFRAAGFDTAALSVDAESPTGAFGLYERLGFAEEHRSAALLKNVD